MDISNPFEGVTYSATYYTAHVYAIKLNLRRLGHPLHHVLYSPTLTCFSSFLPCNPRSEETM